MYFCALILMAFLIITSDALDQKAKEAVSKSKTPKQSKAPKQSKQVEKVIHSPTSTPTANAKYVATFDPATTEGISGTFSLTISTDGSKAIYSFDLDVTGFTNSAGCDLTKPLTYHIHSKWTGTSTSAVGGTACGASATGGHYDPYLACASASGQATNCDLLSRTTAKGYTYACSPTNYFGSKLYDYCEVGDLSGKFGTVTVSGGKLVGGPFIDPVAPVPAEYLTDSAFSPAWSSVVFHCTAPSARTVCAKFLQKE